MRKIFIGDVHGCFKELFKLLEKLKYNKKNDALYFVGDLINRGPGSKEVLDFVMKDNSKVILGNHELSLLRSLEAKSKHAHRFKDLIIELGSNFKAKYLPYLENLPVFIEEDDFLMVHAGIIPGKKINEVDPFFLTTIRTWDGVGMNLNKKGDPPWYNFYFGDKLIIHGHWAEKGLNITHNVIGLDSGCVWGGSLSALVLPGREVYQIKSLKKYAVI